MPQAYKGVINRAKALIEKANGVLPSENAEKPFYFRDEVNNMISELDNGIGKVETHIDGLSSDSKDTEKYENAIEEMNTCKAKLVEIRNKW